MNNICLDALIDKHKSSERDLATEHLSKLGKNNLYLFDRGYFSLNFLKTVKQTHCHFCFRLSKIACSELTKFISEDSSDKITTIKVGKQAIKVRLTKVNLDSGIEEYLLTSLFDNVKFTPQKLKELYHLRWGIEEQIKDIKCALTVENFVGKKVNSIKQEFYANILTYNLSMMMCKPLIDIESNKTENKHIYKTNKRATLAKTKQCLIKLFSKINRLPELLFKIIKVLAKEAIPIRNGRKYYRAKTFKAKPKPSNRTNSVV